MSSNNLDIEKYIDKYKKFAAVDLKKKYEEIKKRIGGKNAKNLGIYEFVCPICESYMSFLLVSDPKKNREKEIGCSVCSHKRKVNCDEIHLFFFLKHTA
jgi:hypothetical protein